MSKPVNATAIGAFLIGGLVLLILALLIFGGGQFFKPKIEWVVYFDTSLNGLNIGAPVKVQGVQVGTVKNIELQLDWDQQRLVKPVVLEIEPWRLTSPDGMPLEVSLLAGDHRKEDIQRLIDAGLRARLEVQSILTGLLYVDLDFRPDQPLRLTGLNYMDLPEVPSIPPTVDEVITTLEDVVKKIRTMPLDQMVDDVAATLADIRQLIGSEETRQARVALAQALTSTQNVMTRLDRQIPALVGALEQTLGSFGQASRDMSATAREATVLAREVNAHAGPVLRAAEQTLVKTTEALDATRLAAGNVADATASDSRLQDALVELRHSAQSLRQLTDYLQRHPDAILYGR